MNKIQVFENKEFGQLRSVIVDGTPWMIGKDVAIALGYKNTRKALSDHVETEDKKDGVTIRDSIGREQNVVVINESGLYSLILSSKLPGAKRFKKILRNLRKGIDFCTHICYTYVSMKVR